MSRPDVTDEVVDGLAFARACVLDQRAASHSREDHGWDKRYAAALAAIDAIVSAHKRSTKEASTRAGTGGSQKILGLSAAESTRAAAGFQKLLQVGAKVAAEAAKKGRKS